MRFRDNWPQLHRVVQSFSVHARALWIGWILLPLFTGVQAKAHDPGISTAQGEVRADVLILVTGFSPLDVQQLLPPALRTDERWSETEFAAAYDQLMVIAPQLWEVRFGDAPQTPRKASVELQPGDS